MNHVLCKRGSAIEVVYVDKKVDGTTVTIAVISRPTVAYEGTEGAGENVHVFTVGMTNVEESDGEYEVYGTVKIIDGAITSMHFDRQITDFTLYKTLMNEKLYELGQKQVPSSKGSHVDTTHKGTFNGTNPKLKSRCTIL